MNVLTLGNPILRQKAEPVAEVIAEALGCDVVSCVGTKFVLYKESEKKKRIELV